LNSKVHIADLGMPPENSRRRGGGREARREARLSASGPVAVKAGASGGNYRPLSDLDVEKIHGAVLEVLESVGIGEPTQEVIDITVPKGAVLSDHGRLCFPRALMEDVLSGAAKDYTVHARGERAGTDDIIAKDAMVHNAISGQAVTFLDCDSLTYRPSTILDIYNFTRVVDVSEHIHMAGVPVMATDILDPIEHDINCAYAVMAATEKTFSMSFTSKESLAKGIELFDIVAGGEGKFAEKPFCIFGGCPLVSPLRFGEENLEILIETARRGLTCDLAVAPQAGATAPAALAGTLVQVVAETLAALAIVNLTNPGTPLTFAAWPFVSDLRTGSFSGGSGEEGLLTAASVQMGNWYGLPTSVPACMTDSKIPDAQSGYEKGMTSVLASIAGCNRVSECAGMMGSLMGISLESLVIDNDMLGAAMRVVRGIEVTDETLSVDVIREVATGPGHYLGHDQTIAMMQTEFLYPSIADRQPQGAWEEQGSPTVFDRARERVAEILSTHYPRHLAGVDPSIRDAFTIHLSAADAGL
jgi:trimethylamine---corrinoid protein Co-methyltransferase